MAFKKIKHKLTNHQILQEAFYTVREEIYVQAKTCADNIKVTISFRSAPVEPLVVIVGKGENMLDIDLNPDGKVTYTWKQSTVAAWGWGFLEGIKSFSAGVVASVGNVVGKTIAAPLKIRYK